jgi:hypothetical protein
VALSGNADILIFGKLGKLLVCRIGVIVKLQPFYLNLRLLYLLRS